jgi:predicted O-methyltransferase YrrM
MTIYNDALSSFITQTFSPEDNSLVHIREQIEARGLPDITVRPEEGRFLQVLVAACRARLALEIGTLGGYSGTWIARGLPDGGRLITLEVDPKRAEIASEHFRLAGVDDRVEIRIGDAHSLLPELSDEGPFDFVFIDADKGNYDNYYEACLPMVRRGGIIAVDNTLWSGWVADSARQDDDTLALRAFNDKLHRDERVALSLLSLGDGVTLALKR